MTMNSKDFFYLVSKMRECQKAYFRTRGKDMLQMSKKLENEVDTEIERVNNILKGKQPTLFDNNK